MSSMLLTLPIQLSSGTVFPVRVHQGAELLRVQGGFPHSHQSEQGFLAAHFRRNFVFVTEGANRIINAFQLPECLGCCDPHVLVVIAEPICKLKPHANGSSGKSVTWEAIATLIFGFDDARS